MRAFWKEVWVGFRVHFRYQQALFWEFALPIFMMVLFALVFGGGRSLQADVAVVASGKGLPAQAGTILQSVPVLRLTRIDEKAVDRALGRFHAVVVLEGNGRSLHLTLLMPGRTDAARREMVRAAVARVAFQMNARLVDLPVAVIERAVGPAAADITYSQFLVPGILGVAALATGLFGVSISYVVDRNGGRLRLLQLAPRTLAPYFAALSVRHYLVTLTQAIVITALAIWWMGVKVLGQPAHLLIYYTLGTFAFIVLGAAIGVLVPSIQGARGLAQASYMFMVFLGGAFYGLPGSLEHLTLWLPLSLFLRGFRQLFSEGAGLVQVLGPALGLLGWMAIGLLALGLARAREAHDA